MTRTQYKMADMERKSKPLHYIYTSRSLSYKPAFLACSLHKHRMIVATPLVTDLAWSRCWGEGTMFCIDVVVSGEEENPLSLCPKQGSPWYGLMSPPTTLLATPCRPRYNFLLELAWSTTAAPHVAPSPCGSFSTSIGFYLWWVYVSWTSATTILF